MLNKFSTQMMRNQIFNVINDEYIEIPQKWMDTLENLMYRMLIQKIITSINIYTLRGGGSMCSSKAKSDQYKIINQLPNNFCQNIKHFTNVIVEKAMLFHDKFNQDEIICAFMWFHNNQEYLQSLCINQGSNLEHYDIVEITLDLLVKQLTIYLKLSGYLLHSLLQICNDLLRVIFYYQKMNPDRYMQVILKDKFLSQISELEEQIKIESNNIWVNGIDFELQMIKICLTHCRTNSQEGQKLAMNILSGIVTSISQLKPSQELIDSLVEAGKYLLLNFYDKQIKNPLQIYELYFFFQNLKWTILNQLKSGYSVQKTIMQFNDAYNQYIRKSQNWIVHYCWINLISELMSYRIIISKSQMKFLLDQFSGTQITLVSLFESNHITPIPYDKQQVKVKIFDNQNLNLKDFACLKLFQEYLINEQEKKIQLLPDYTNFEFDSSSKNPNNILDLYITLILNEDNIDLLLSLNCQIKKCKVQLKQNFEQITNQISLTFLKQNSQQDFKICLQDLQYLINQQKQQSLQLLYLFYEIDIARIKEILNLKAFEQIVKYYSLNQRNNKENIQIPNSDELEKECQMSFVQNLVKIPKLWIIISKILCMYSEDIFDMNIYQKLNKESISNILKDFEQLLLIVQDTDLYLDSFVIKIKKAKKGFQNIFISNNINSSFQEKTSQRDLWENIIKIYNSSLIKSLISEIHSYHTQNWKNNIWKFETLQDFENNLVKCIEIRDLFKGLKKLFRIHQSKLFLLQYENIVQKISSENDMQSENEKDDERIQEIKIQNLIFELKSQLKIFFEKYPKIDITKEELKELNGIEKAIQFNLLEIQQKNWSQERKLLCIMTFQKILNQISLLGLCKVDKQILKQDIFQLLDNYLQKSNSIDQSSIQINFENKKQQEFQHLHQSKNFKQQNYFDFEKVTSQLNEIIYKTKKIKQIIIQNRNYQIWITQVSDQLLKQIQQEDFQGNIKEIIFETLISIELFLSSIIEQEQFVFNKDKFTQASLNLNIDLIAANLILLNQNSILQDPQLNQMENVKCDKIYYQLLTNLENTSTIQKEWGFQDIFENSSYKVREVLVYNLIKMQAQVQESQIQTFCTNLIKKIWIYEKHPNVRNLLKNKELMEIQKKMFSHNLMTFQQRLKLEIQTMLKNIELLENSVLTENSPQMKNQLQQAIDEFEIYFDNITDMSQRLDINLIFLKEISKDLKSLKSSIDLVLKNLNGIVNDIRKLRGKNYFELFLIRKDYILKQKMQNEIDQVHIQLQTQEYDPISGSKLQNNSGGFTSYLLQYQYDNFVGEVNEFLWNKKERRKDVMLLKGKAGSGKSRASINIEELLWNFDQIEPKWIPIYISLPSVKDPQHNLIEQGLQSENYNFDGIQIRELKEAVIAGNLNIVLILESYDEMKLDCQRINLYTSNRLVKDLNIKESGQNVKIIITTRDEILTSIGYQTWFYGKSLDTLKEVELLPFSSEQSSEYLSLYSEISVKRTIKRFYEFLKQLKGQNFSYVQFKTLWCQLEEDIQQILLCNQNQQMLFSIQDAEKIIQKIQNVEFFNLFQPDLINSLIKDLIQLWSKHKFLQIINNINIGNLLNTPFMLEIIVYVLPKMSLQFSQASFMRDILKINYNILKKESLKSINLVTKYLQLKDTQQDSLKQNENFDCTKSNQKLKDFDNKEISELLKSLLEELENQNFFEQHSIAHQLELQNNQIISQNKKFNVKFDAQFIVGAFKMNQQTAFDFYNVFVDFYHAQQIQKWMDLGKAINYESFMIDLKDFSTNLAIDMSIRQLTQVNYQQKGKLILQQVIYNKNIHNSWEDCYFSENEQDSDYKGLLRKCMLICSKGNQFAFNHKSIQEFFVANYILNFLEKAIEIDFKINQEELLQSLFNKNDFNLSLDQYQGTLELLKPKLKLLSNIKQRLIEIINFQKIVQNSQQQIEFIRAPSNSFYLLSCLGEYLEEQNFSKLQISNTKLNGLSLFKCNLNNTIFDNVSIDSCNFSCSTIENANWTNLLCKEKPSLIGHNKNVVSLNFNTAGSSLITGSIDGMIKIWPIYQDQEPLSLSFENEQIYSLSYVETHNKIACLTNNELKILNSKDLSFFNHRKFYNYEYERINVSPDFNYIAVIQGVWKNQVLFILEMKNLTEIQNQGDIHQIQNSSLIQCIALSYDQKILAVGGQEISFWNVTNIINIQKIADLKIELKKKPLIKFSSNNELLATYDEDDNAIQFWRIKDLNNIVWLNSFGNSQPVAQMEFLENNKYFVIRTYQVIICDLLKLLEDQEAISQQFSINFKEIALSPNSQTLACIEETFKSSLKLFDIQDIQNIKQIGVLIENMEQLQLLRFSFDGIFLICCKSKEILIWNVSQQQLQNAIVVPQDKIIDIIISQDQKTLISCSLNQILIISDVFEMNYSNQFKIIDINFNCQGVNFWNNTIIAIFGQNNEASIIQIFDLQQQKILDQISKDEMVQNVYFINQYSMVTLGESCRIYNSYGDKINFKESKNFQIKGQYSKFYPNNKYLLIYDFDFIFIIDTDSLHFHKIKVQSKSKLYELSSNLKFLVSITTIGIEIKLIDKLIESKQIWKYQANDFSISSNQSLIALPLENSLFAKQDQILIICLRNKMLFYDIQDLQQIKKIKNYVLIGQPVKVLFFEPTNQIIVFYKNFITLQNIDNLQQCNIVQSQLQDKILPQVFSQNNIYYGISWQNKTISFSSYSDSISIKLFQQIGGFKYNQFGQTGNTITLITNDNSIFQYNLEQDCIIDKGNLIQFGEIFRLDMNQQQTKLLLNIENKKMNTQRLELIDFLSMKSIQFLEEFNAGIHYCQKAVFCEECSYLITAYSSVTIKLWDLKTCKLLSTFKSSTERIDQIQISAKGILAQVGNEIIKLWNLNALKQQQIEIDGHQTSITLISISQDGLQLASGSIQEIIRWDLSNFQKIDVLLKGNKLPPCFCFSNDCNYFAALDDLHYIRLWKLNTKYLVVSSHVIKYKYNAQAIKFNLENTKIIAKYENGIKILWNLSTEQLIEDSNINLHQEICSNQILFSYDSQYLVTFSPIQIINLFDEKKEKLQIQDEVLIEKVQCMAISHNNLRLAIQNQNCIFLWSIEKMEIIIQFGKGLKISQCLAFSNNDQVLFSINNEFLVQLWDVNDKYTIIKEISIAPIIDDPIFTPMMHKTVAYPLDEEKFFVVYSLTIGFNIIQSDYLKVCIIPDHEKEWDISSDYYTYHFDSAFSSKKQLLALQWFREFKLFETNSMKLFVNLEPNKLERTTYTQQLSFSKSGRFLLSLNQDKTISLWDLDSKVSIQQKVNTKQHLNINSFIFHQDEENIIVLGLNYQIYHDHISNYTDKFIFQSQEVQENFDYVIKEINQYTINYKENELKIIEKQSGNQICIINQFSSKLNSASFSPCGRNIILGMKDGSILFYKIDQETLDKQGLPTFFKCLNRFPLLMAPYCKLQNSVLQSKENENLAKLFIEKGAKI